MRSKLLILTVTLAVSAMSAFADTAPCIVNIVNFVRKTEPRIDAITDDILYKPPRANWQACFKTVSTAHFFCNTMLSSTPNTRSSCARSPQTSK